MKDIRIEEATREQVAEFLPCAIRKAFGSYHDFVHAVPDDERSKSFKEHHNACKVAVAHIALLLELAGRMQVDMEDLAKDDPGLRNAMAEYQKHLTGTLVPE